VAIGIAPGAIKVWDTASGDELLTLSRGPEMRLAFSADGRRLISASAASVRVWDAKVWDVATGEELTVSDHEPSFGELAVSAFGKHILSSQFTGSLLGGGHDFIELRNASRGELEFSLTRWNGGVLAVDKEGQRVATAENGKNIKLWDVATGVETVAIGTHGENLTCLKFSPDGKRLAAAIRDQYGPTITSTIKVWNALTGQEFLTLDHAGYVEVIAFSPDGQRLAAASFDGMVKIWVASGSELLKLGARRYGSERTKVAFSLDGKRIASGGKVWDSATGLELLTLRDNGSCMAFSPSGKLLAAANGNVGMVADAETGQTLHSLWEHDGHLVYSLAFSPSGKQLVSSCAQSTIRVWDTATGKKLLILRGHRFWVNQVAFNPDGKSLASASKDSTVKIWDAVTGQELFALGHAGSVTGISYSPDGHQLASASEDRTVRLWDLTSKRQLRVIDHSGPVLSVAFSPDGRQIASGTGDKAVNLWDAATGQCLATMQGHSGPVSAVAFAPDGTRLASAGGDGTVAIWPLRTASQREY
jgi:WD40 repeat protein